MFNLFDTRAKEEIMAVTLKVRNIAVTFNRGERKRITITQEFSDWYDFADFLKQENLAGHDITISDWKYVNGIIQND